MITFARPVFLYLLLLLPLLLLLLIWSERRRQSDLARLGEPHLIARLTTSLYQRARGWKNWLWFAAITLLVLASARPQWGSQVQKVEQRGIQLMVALDISKSMLAQDLKPDRLSRARLEIREIMSRLDGDEIGLVLFSGASFIQFPLTSDYATARSFLDAASPAAISSPGTAIGEAIRTAARGFDPSRASQKVILLVSDGEAHDENAMPAARQAAEQGVLIYTIGFGSQRGEPIPAVNDSGEVTSFIKDSEGQIVLSRLNEALLMEIASAAGGKYYRASAAGDEITALLGEIDSLQSSSYNTQFESLSVERYQLFLLTALTLLLTAELLPERRRSSDQPEGAAEGTL